MAFNLDWEHVAVVGKGGSSTVYKALIKSTGAFVAVKQIEIDGLSKDQINGIKGEIETMKDLSHPNILRYLGTQQSPNRVFIFLEYADRGSLRHFYSNRGPLSESQITFCLQGIVAGLNYLHENGIAHRDIKCANCLLGSEGVVKLADFGASKRFESDSIVSGLKGTPHWMAPEVIKGTQMTTGWMKADVWSLGCTVVEMFTAKVPYAEYENPMTAMYKIASGEVPSFKPSILQPNMPSEGLVSFIHTCCAVEPATRPSADQLLQHALLTREIDGVGDLFVDTSLAVGTAPGELPVDGEAPKAQSPTMFTQHEKENNKMAAARRSLEEGEAALHEHYRHANHSHTIHSESTNFLATSLRPRSDSTSSVLSGNDDDETTIANHAEASYLEDDFCSYGYEDLGHSRSRGESLSLGQGTGIGFNDCGKTNEDLITTKKLPTTQGVVQVTQASKEPRTQVRLTPLSVPRASSSSRSNSRSRGKNATGSKNGPSPRNAMVINTSTTAAVDLDASVGSDLDEVATPSVFRDNGRSASMQMQMQSLLHEEVGGLTLSESSKAPAPLVRKWSATAFPEEALPKTEETKLSLKPSNTDDSVVAEKRNFSDVVVSEITDFSVSETVADLQQQHHDPSQQASEVRPVYNVPVVPSFEDANAVYQNMLMKYSPRGVRTSQDAPLVRQQPTQENEPKSEQESTGPIDPAVEQDTTEIVPSATEPVCVQESDATEMLVSPTMSVPATVSLKVAPNESQSTPTQRSSRTRELSPKVATTTTSNSAKAKTTTNKSRESPLSRSSQSSTTHSQSQEEDTGLHIDNNNIPSGSAKEVASPVATQESALEKDSQATKVAQRSKAKQSAGLAPLDAGRARGMDPQRRQQAIAAQARPVAPVTDPVQIRSRIGEDTNKNNNSNNSSSSSRPYAPLSGEKLRLHSFADPKKPGDSAEALERIVNQSGAAAVRKNAAQELREVRTHKAKGSLSHHVIKTSKRPRNEVSPRHQARQQHSLAAVPYGQQPSNQLGSAQGQNRVTAHMGTMNGGALLLNNGGVRSQSAGVATGYTTSFIGSLGSPSEPHKDNKLPPVLRGMNRHAVGSSSGSIDPIEEGRVPTLLRLDGTLNGPTSRYIQSAPAVSRSLNLPPINAPGQQGQRPSHRHGASVDSTAGLGASDSPDESAYLTSLTPKTKQPRLHNFGRPTHTDGGTHGVSAVLQQSFANVMKTYADTAADGHLSPTNGAI